jgi:hypothetical protein
MRFGLSFGTAQEPAPPPAQREQDAFWYDDLTAEQQRAYSQLQEGLQGKLSPGLDTRMDLLRFLKARQFDVPRALQMYNNMAKWRREVGVDALYCSATLGAAPAWGPPPSFATRDAVITDEQQRAIHTHYKHFYHKTDRFGRPVYYELSGQSTPHLLCEHLELDVFINYHIVQVSARASRG